MRRRVARVESTAFGRAAIGPTGVGSATVAESSVGRNEPATTAAGVRASHARAAGPRATSRRAGRPRASCRATASTGGAVDSPGTRRAAVASIDSAGQRGLARAGRLGLRIETRSGFACAERRPARKRTDHDPPSRTKHAFALACSGPCLGKERLTLQRRVSCGAWAPSVAQVEPTRAPRSHYGPSWILRLLSPERADTSLTRDPSM